MHRCDTELCEPTESRCACVSYLLCLTHSPYPASEYACEDLLSDKRLSDFQLFKQCVVQRDPALEPVFAKVEQAANQAWKEEEEEQKNQESERSEGKHPKSALTSLPSLEPGLTALEAIRSVCTAHALPSPTSVAEVRRLESSTNYVRQHPSCVLCAL